MTRCRNRPIAAMVLTAVLVVNACSSAKSSQGGGSASSAVGVSTSAPKPVPGGSIVYAQEAEDAGGLCLPEAQLDVNGINYARAIYDTLTMPNDKGEFVPYLAKSVEHNADFSEWTIVLRDGVTFHDGSPLDATVVKNNLDAYRGAYPARHPILFSLVFGPYLKSVDAVGPMTVKVIATQSWPAFPSYLWSSSRLGIMAQKQLDGDDCAKNPIGTGPFKFREWVVNDHLTVDKNPTYWQTDKDGVRLPYLDSITFTPVVDGQQRLNTLVSGQAQLALVPSNALIDQVRALARDGSVTNIESDQFADVAHLMLCTAPPTDTVCPGSPFNNAHARRAVALALDRQTWIHLHGKDVPKAATGPFAPGAVGYLEDSGFPAFDLNEAKKEVAAYAAETGKDLEFTYGTINDPDFIESQQLIKGMFEAAGMKVSTYSVEQTQGINNAVSRNFQMADWQNFPGSDPDSLFVWWHCNNAPPAPCDNLVNFNGFNDATINADLEKGRVETDPVKRRAMYEDLNREFAKQLYDIWVSWGVWSVATSPKLHGVFGPPLPDGSSPYNGLAVGHPLLGLFVTP